MSTLADLQLSIQDYENQLAQVEQAIEFCTDATEKASLENLKRDLQELLLLTLETLKEETEPSTSAGDDHSTGTDVVHDDDSDNDDANDPFDDEMARFMSEIREAERLTAKSRDNDKLNKLREQLQDVVGKKCSAPYTQSWGGTTYHNALICSADNVDNVDIENVTVKVLFTNPTQQSMIPCPFYLNGECRFDTDKCRFSHGENVLYSAIQEYNEPDFKLLNRNRCPVLAKKSDNVWYRGRVKFANFDDKTCKVTLEHAKEEISCDFVDVFPLCDDSQNASSSSDLSSDDEADDYEAMHQASIIEKSLLSPAPSQALGEWEKYTKGFGSKMLQRFGYIPGTGLGQNGEGIIIPISAQILPPRRSLDHCMQLREQANGDKDLFSVERKMKRLKKKQDANNVKAYERAKSKTDVFSFINDNIFSSSSAAPQPKDQAKTTEKKHFNEHTNKHLNVEKFKIGEDIRRKEREIEKVQEALKRHRNGTPIHTHMDSQLQIKRSELDILKKSEHNMAKEQNLRKDKHKLTIF